MAVNEELKKKSFLDKHKPISSKEVAQRINDSEEAKKSYTQDMVEIEKNFQEFAEKTDPILYNGKVLCWCKRPTKTQLLKLTPDEIKAYKNNPESVPQEVYEKYDDNIYQLMEELIAKPKHDAKWWKENAPLIFLPLFQIHLNEIYEIVGIQIENF